MDPFLGSPPPGHHFVTFLLREIRHLFLDPVSFCLCNPLLPPFGPTRNLRCTVLGDQFQASFASVPVLQWKNNKVDSANLMDPFWQGPRLSVGSPRGSSSPPFSDQPWSQSLFLPEIGFLCAKLAGRTESSLCPTSHFVPPRFCVLRVSNPRERIGL